MDYSTWEKSVPEAITTDPLWRVEAYRLALFLADLGWYDVTKLMSDRRTLSLADQLYRAVGGIGSQIAEGYSRGTGRDRARFYEYALGSVKPNRTTALSHDSRSARATNARRGFVIWSVVQPGLL